MATTAYRYTLQKYAGPKSRYNCPACKKPRCFTRYFDTATGELLPEKFGRCNRESNCGYHLKPQWDCQSAPADSSRSKERRKYLPVATLKSVITTSSNLLTIPDDVFTGTLDRNQYQHNALAKLLRHHFGVGVADELLQRFSLGTSSYWPGACVFWLIDERNRVRGGQVVLYNETGHTVKYPHRHTTWVHSALRQKYEMRQRSLPPWLSQYAIHAQKSPCLFGLPQLATTPAWQPVALVESAKTAIVATPYFPEYIWLATMGLSYLTAERLEPLRGRRIVLFPDAGALRQWQVKAEELRRQGFVIQVSETLEQIVTDKERQDGLDIADVLLREWPGYPPTWDEKATISY